MTTMQNGATNPASRRRIGIFIDGRYFYKVSNHYKFNHPVQSRISIGGLERYVGTVVRDAQSATWAPNEAIETHYFQSVPTPELMNEIYPEPQRLLAAYQSARAFETVLLRDGVVIHSTSLTRQAEKGVDVGLALQVEECMSQQGLDCIVLLTGDGDFVPLAQKIRRRGGSVILLAWDLQSCRDDIPSVCTSQQLIRQVDQFVPMHDEIEKGLQVGRPEVRSLFVRQSEYRQAA